LIALNGTFVRAKHIARVKLRKRKGIATDLWVGQGSLSLVFVRGEEKEGTGCLA
jgi:hypothetical protein